MIVERLTSLLQEDGDIYPREADGAGEEGGCSWL